MWKPTKAKWKKETRILDEIVDGECHGVENVSNACTKISVLGLISRWIYTAIKFKSTSTLRHNRKVKVLYACSITRFHTVQYSTLNLGVQKVCQNKNWNIFLATQHLLILFFCCVQYCWALELNGMPRNKIANVSVEMYWLWHVLAVIWWWWWWWWWK